MSATDTITQLLTRLLGEPLSAQDYAADPTAAVRDAVTDIDVDDVDIRQAVKDACEGADLHPDAAAAVQDAMFQPAQTIRVPSERADLDDAGRARPVDYGEMIAERQPLDPNRSVDDDRFDAPGREPMPVGEPCIVGPAQPEPPRLVDGEYGGKCVTPEGFEPEPYLPENCSPPPMTEPCIEYTITNCVVVCHGDVPEIAERLCEERDYRDPYPREDPAHVCPTDTAGHCMPEYLPCDELPEYGDDGYDQWGYDRKGYDADGYDAHGYDDEGYNRQGYDRKGYDADGYDHQGYDAAGYDHDGNPRPMDDREMEPAPADAREPGMDDEYGDDPDPGMGDGMDDEYDDGEMKPVEDGHDDGEMKPVEDEYDDGEMKPVDEGADGGPRIRQPEPDELLDERVSPGRDVDEVDDRGAMRPVDEAEPPADDEYGDDPDGMIAPRHDDDLLDHRRDEMPREEDHDLRDLERPVADVDAGGPVPRPDEEYGNGTRPEIDEMDDSYGGHLDELGRDVREPLGETWGDRITDPAEAPAAAKPPMGDDEYGTGDAPGQPEIAPDYGGIDRPIDDRPIDPASPEVAAPAREFDVDAAGDVGQYTPEPELDSIPAPVEPVQAVPVEQPMEQMPSPMEDAGEDLMEP